MKTLFGAAFLPLLSACSAFDLINNFVDDDQSDVQQEVAYGSHPRQRLDIYHPREPAPDAAVIVFFYGGGWDSGKRQDYEFVARKLAAEGHYVALPDYRLYPEVRFPVFVEDGALATAFVLDQVATLAGERRPVYLMGHSAGAHIAMLVAMNSRYLAAYGQNPRQLCGVIGLAGPYDFLPLTSRRLLEIFPDEGERYRSQPIYYANLGAPPVMLAHGDKDNTVWLRNSVNMAARLRESGAFVRLQVYPGLGHIDMIKPFLPFYADKSGLIREILAFITEIQTERAAGCSAHAREPVAGVR